MQSVVYLLHGCVHAEYGLALSGDFCIDYSRLQNLVDVSFLDNSSSLFGTPTRQWI